MSEFKEQVAEDINSVFMNIEEFADTHNLNGVECECIIQSPTIREKLINGADYDGYEGVHGETLIIHVAASSLEEVPMEGQVFKVDGSIYTVQNCIVESGLMTIEVGGSIGG